MAVKTGFSKSVFIDLLSNYNLGDYIDSKPIEKGTVQTNYFLQTTKGKYVFRYYENRSVGSVKFENDLIKYLKGKGYPCPDVYASKEGVLIGIYKDKPFVIFEFVEGEHLENPSPTQQNQLIEKVAELQILTRNYDAPNKSDRWNYDSQLCLELARKEADSLNTESSRKKLKWFEAEVSKLSLPSSLPKGICHCDFHFSNILFKDGEFKALIDFDDANYTYLVFDLATLINPFIPTFDWNSWSNLQKYDNVFDFKDASKMVFEYMKYRSLSDDEKLHLFDVFKLSILFDCIWYFKRGEAEDFYEKRKIDYLNSLGREKFYDNLFGASSN